MFYFSCNCGSKVFFDDLGGAWPEHQCIQYLVARYGKEFVERGLAQQMMRPGIPRKYRFDADYEQRVRHAAAVPPRIVRRDPRPDTEVTATGVIRELIRDPDVFKKAGVPDTVIGRALLGPVGREAMWQVTVHVGSIADEDVDSFTFYIPKRLALTQELVVNTLVSFEIQSYVVPGKTVLWIATHLGAPV